MEACTRDPDRSRAINVVGPCNLATAASRIGADLVHVERTLEVIERGHYGTYHLVNTRVCSYYDIVVEIGQILGMPAEQRWRLIRRSTAAVAPWITARPPCTPLRCLLSEDLGLPVLRSWRIALADYLSRESGR